MPTYDAAVIGGGFAGLSAAVSLARRGARVIVLEERPRLGGRATSYRERVTGEWVDNGQHVIFGCYRETLRFLDVIDATDAVRLQSTLRVSYASSAGVVRLQCPRLPPPLNLLGGIIEWDAIAMSERMAIFRMVGPLRRAQRHARGDWRGAVAGREETVSQWLVRHGQGPRLRALLWEPLALAALNQSADVVAAPAFARVLAELCGPGAHDAAVGLPLRPLSELYAEPARRYLEAHGGVVRTRAPARISFVGTRLVGVESGGELIPVPVVVSAVPWFALSRVLDPPPSPLARLLQRAAAMDASPIVTVHLWLDGQVLDEAFMGLLDQTSQWVFDKRSLFGPTATHLTLVASGARELLGRSNDQLIAQALADLRTTLPRARVVSLVRGLVIRERRATFSLAPGQPPRPETRTALPGLYLAGDWIETGLPSTIEGAVRSGHRAADAACQYLARSSGPTLSTPGSSR